jgi:hypothetical protein
MKPKYLLLIPLLCLSFISKAQLTADFPDSNYYWNANYTFSPWEMGTRDEFDFTLYYKSDTIINNQTYQKLFIKYSILNYNGYWGPGGVNYHGDKYYGLIRNDKINKRVYIKREAYLHNFPRTYTDSAETLLYDFGLNVGDIYPITIHNKTIDSNVYIFKIDTIIDPQNVKRACYFIHPKFGGPSDTTFLNGVVIQGVGGRNGLIGDFFDYWDYSYIESFSCFKINSIGYQPQISDLHASIYEISYCDKHEFLSVENNKSKNISVTPNPVTSTFTINIPDEEATFTLINTLGQSQEIQGVREGSIWNLNVSTLENGIYFITILTDKNQYSSRFIKIN